MDNQLYQGTYEENEDSTAQWCYPDEHDMTPEGDDNNQWYFCVKCGYQATVYVVNNYMREPLQV